MDSYWVMGTCSLECRADINGHAKSTSNHINNNEAPSTGLLRHPAQTSIRSEDDHRHGEVDERGEGLGDLEAREEFRVQQCGDTEGGRNGVHDEGINAKELNRVATENSKEVAVYERMKDLSASAEVVLELLYPCTGRGGARAELAGQIAEFGIVSSNEARHATECRQTFFHLLSRSNSHGGIECVAWRGVGVPFNDG
ncbi:hypothetical protein C1H76_2654 [Elsinoe australis]|uniref:Uncharacterized protein n=1 Tax=Elsinoe australis TaxID=40998 RepID=A0A4U7B1J5_9PEZI|nr:hypothetical protein C1H76_2654 [Elsinoe australis]